MKRLILTPVEPLVDHCTYCLVIIDNDKYDSYFTNTVDFSTSNSTTYGLDSDIFSSPWDLHSVKSINDLLNHPSVLTYTEESHPELFL